MALPRPNTVLLIEDDHDLVELISDSLIAAGFRVLASGKVSDAVMKLRNQSFDCIVLDLKLEQGSGEQIVSALLQDKKGHNFTTPIILTSGFMERGVIERIGKRISGALVKPFDHAALVSMLKALCEKGRLSPPTTPAS